MNVNTDKIEKIKLLSKDERIKVFTNYIESVYDPNKDSTLSLQEVRELGLSSDTATADEFKKILADMQAKVGQKIYKYNVSNTGPNSLLLDLRNYHNFRSLNNANAGTDPSTGKPSAFGTGIRAAATSPSKSYYMSQKDFLFAERLDMNVDAVHFSEVQPIILNEFQPDKITYATELGVGAMQLLGGKVKSGAAGLIGIFGHTLGSGFAGKNLNNAMQEYYSLNPKALYDADAYGNHGNMNPMTFVKKMFKQGKWLNTYQLPFIGGSSNLYLKADKSTANWNVGRIIGIFW